MIIVQLLRRITACNIRKRDSAEHVGRNTKLSWGNPEDLWIFDRFLTPFGAYRYLCCFGSVWSFGSAVGASLSHQYDYTCVVKKIRTKKVEDFIFFRSENNFRKINFEIGNLKIDIENLKIRYRKSENLEMKKSKI